MGLEPPAGARDEIEAARRSATGALATYEERAYLTYAGAGASDLLDEPVYDAEGDEAGTLSDLVLSEDGRLTGLVVERSGLGLGESVLLPAGAVTLTSDETRRPRVRAEVASLPDDAPDFEEDALPGGSLLASELIGAEVELGGGGTDRARLGDLAMTLDGRIEAVSLDLGGEVHAVPFAELSRGQGDEVWVIGSDAASLREGPTYVGEPAYAAE